MHVHCTYKDKKCSFQEETTNCAVKTLFAGHAVVFDVGGEAEVNGCPRGLESLGPQQLSPV